jgi:hypothetical protein
MGGRPKAPRLSARSIPKNAKAAGVFEIKVTIAGVQPPVWRRLLVPADLRLDQLHNVLQAAFGWSDSHLHHFYTGDRRKAITYYGMPPPDGDDGGMPEEDERRFSLRDLAPGKGAPLAYEYDFGDSWLHQIKVERVIKADEAGPTPRCISGARACPPEDVGGAWGYGEFLEILADPGHEQHKEMMEWAGEFDPEAFNQGAANAALANPAGSPSRRRRFR